MRSATKLREYARNGGGLLGTFETARYDAAGARRRNWAWPTFLARLWQATSKVRTAMRIHARIEQRHAVLAGFEETNVLPGAEYRLPVKTRLPQALTVVPPYPAPPPGWLFARRKRTSRPS